jgi:hypothetical protein
MQKTETYHIIQLFHIDTLQVLYQHFKVVCNCFQVISETLK